MDSLNPHSPPELDKDKQYRIQFVASGIIFKSLAMSYDDCVSGMQSIIDMYAISGIHIVGQ